MRLERITELILNRLPQSDTLSRSAKVDAHPAEMWCDSMEITDVRIRKIEGDGNLRAFASITFDGAFVVHDLKVIKGRKGHFVAMPSRRMADGEFRDMAHPIVMDTRMAIQEAVLGEYRKVAASDEEVLNSLLAGDPEGSATEGSMEQSGPF